MKLIRFAACFAAAIFIFANAQTSLAAVFTVTNTNDSGAGSLRQAVLDANVNNEDDSINFDPAVFSTSQTILLTSGEVVIAADNSTGSPHSLSINGTGADRLEINGNDHSRIFRIGFQGRAFIDKVKLSGGNGTSNGEIPDINSSGGAIILDGDPTGAAYNLTLTNSILSGNRSTHNNASGGAMTVFGRVLVINSAIVNNVARYFGAGFDVLNSELRMFNSTVSQNTAQLVGGIYASDGRIYLTNSIVTRNLSTGQFSDTSGIMLTTSINGSVDFYPRNSIIANNRASVMPPRDIFGPVKSRGNNIIGNSLGMYFVESSPSDLVDVDPLLALNLSTNGGVIPSHALAAGSPAVDTGNNCVLLAIADGGCSDVAITHDHRGVVRPQDGNSDGTAVVDRGTFEVTPAEVAAAPGTPDLHAADDSGVSDTDNITAIPDVTFDVGNLMVGATVEFFRSGVLVGSGVAAGTTMTFEDSLTIAGTYVYTARQTFGGVTSVYGGAVTVKFDNVAPTGSIVQAVGQADPTRLQPINFTTTFNEAVVGFDSADITFAGSTAGTGSATAAITGSSTTYSVQVGNVSSDGSVVVGVLAGGIQDLAGNSNVAFTGADNSVTLDTTPPAVTINQSATQADPTRFLPINFTVTFSEPVTGFTNADVSLAGSTASVGSATKTVTGTGPTYNVAIGNITSNGGTVVASIVASAAQDAAGNSSVASTSSDNSVVFDNTAPTVTINQAVGQTDPTNSLPINYTVVFSEPVTGFDTADLLFTGSTINTVGASSVVTGSGTTYNVAIGNITSGGGLLRVSIRGGAAIDIATNLSVASSSTDNTVFVDNVSPSVTVNQAAGQPDPATNQPINFTVTFSEAVTGFQASDVSLAGSTANVVSANIQVSGSGSSYTVSVSSVTSSGQVRVSVPAGVAVDVLGNSNLASTSTDNTVTLMLRPSAFDFDGDSKTDIGIFRPAGAASEWWVNRSSTGQTFALQFGASTDKIVPADYTGDGKADIAFFRPSSGEWYVLRSEDFSFFALPFGANGDVPVPADYDADGKADFAVFRPSSATWFISQSSGAPTRIEGFGVTGDQPVVADYDGDRKADIGIFRQAAGGAEWWINRSTAGSLALQFGANTDRAVQGDYTGDGKADIAIWRPSTGEWLIVRSEDFSFYGFPFGASTDTPAPGDYDGDGKFDATVFRPSSATWFIARSTAGTQIVQFGATGDQPIPNAFVP